MNKDKLIGLYILWVVVLIIELGWLYTVATGIYQTGTLAFIITLITTTIITGAVGLNLISKFINY
ncbi:hypothetical protein CEY16_11505 [Halalkalibacillus sediminis]|uniref:Uncharacterized protein n=1 Tax=Halalkalibacillus sediminis TaxID=2018042 RepID=A0A2I0QSN6_9BACI|nr:hypothetical protein [Halalkalibacillus sediminis]PKR77351.1 hypothetical protein CEY16_11505 [Halalkalibacillus sediminis]